MSSLDRDSKPETVVRVGSSNNKRISTLNEHEDHILRRRIDAYQKIHNKEIAGVSSKLDEVRESMKALATDPSYGTHALSNADSSDGARPLRIPANNGQKTKLRRTQSFPEVLEGPNIARSSTSVLPALKSEHGVSRFAAKSLGERTVLNGRARSTSSPQIPESVQLGREAKDWQEMGHKKLERSKTAPVTMLQPLLKTTPEMMRAKIHISTSNRISNDEAAPRRGLSPRVGDARFKMQPLQAQDDPGNILLRPKTTPDSQLGTNFKHIPSRPTSHDSRKAPKFLSKRVASRAEPNEDLFASVHSTTAHGSKSANNNPANTPQKIHGEFFETNDNEQSIEDLKYCRYLRFSKENQESNRI